jgi:DNA-binding NarL/FixJ family response regulator
MRLVVISAEPAVREYVRAQVARPESGDPAAADAVDVVEVTASTSGDMGDEAMDAAVAAVAALRPDVTVVDMLARRGTAANGFVLARELHGAKAGGRIVVTGVEDGPYYAGYARAAGADAFAPLRALSADLLAA